MEEVSIFYISLIAGNRSKLPDVTSTGKSSSIFGGGGIKPATGLKNASVMSILGESRRKYCSTNLVTRILATTWADPCPLKTSCQSMLKHEPGNLQPRLTARTKLVTVSLEQYLTLKLAIQTVISRI